MKKFYRTKEEMVQDLQEERKEAEQNYVATFEKAKESRKKLMIKVISIIAIVVIFIKVCFGTIHIMSPFIYKQNRLYQVYINDELINVEVFDHYHLPIVPHLVSFDAINAQSYDYDGGHLQYEVKEDDDKILLSFVSYKCMADDYQVQLSCNAAKKSLRKVEATDVKYTHLYIRREDRKETVMYDGPMIQNITQYVQKEGRYHIRVTAEYKHVTSSITFHLKNK